MSAKKVNFSIKPNVKSIGPDNWVAAREIPESVAEKPSEKMKRLTLDLPESLHRAIKRRAVDKGTTMIELIRTLLEKHYGQGTDN
jgi:predicted DNA binding CopG/RHH family protein